MSSQPTIHKCVGGYGLGPIQSVPSGYVFAHRPHVCTHNCVYTVISDCVI